MYLHIGKDIIIKNDNIIGIFDIKSLSKNKDYLKIYEELKKDNKIVDISDKNEKTFILIKENNNFKGYISNISSITLGKRFII